ncbi:MAG TPA: glycoside hydrolase family 43 protein [Fimbriimonadaceae bacterium]|nr:glycoside hydrolase family 43 protein [Fimbriimonadaceae bacterium]
MFRNPVLPGYYADPELHFFEGRYWIYPTTSLPYERQNSFEAFSSEDLLEWRHEGVILDIRNLEWGKGTAAWAPSCAHAQGKYWLYFSVGDGDGIGVASSDSPGGPFRDVLGRPLVSEYHHGAQPIDAHCFVDDDGSAYLYWGGWRRAVVARLGDDMASYGEVREITPELYVEGPFMLKRDGLYYFMWSEGSWGDETYNVAWSRSESPYGPFTREGELFLRSPEVGTSAGHHSVLEKGGRHLVAYHRRPLGETDRNSRVVCLQKMTFDPDGRILPITLI